MRTQATETPEQREYQLDWMRTAEYDRRAAQMDEERQV